MSKSRSGQMPENGFLVICVQTFIRLLSYNWQMVFYISEYLPNARKMGGGGRIMIPAKGYAFSWRTVARKETSPTKAYTPVWKLEIAIVNPPDTDIFSDFSELAVKKAGGEGEMEKL